MIYKSNSSILELEAPVVPDTSLLQLATNRDLFLDLLLPRDARVSGDVVVSFIILVMLCLLLFVYTEVILGRNGSRRRMNSLIFT